MAGMLWMATHFLEKTGEEAKMVELPFMWENT